MLYQQVRARGWAAFRAGSYRSAAFELHSASSIVRDDATSRLGLMVCEVALTRYRTALTHMRAYLATEGPAALDRTVAFGAQFGSPQAYLAVRNGLQRFAVAHADDDSVVALLAFFLWHAGADRDAINIADQLAGRRPDSPYAGWAARMRSEARDASALGDGTGS